MPVYGRSLPFEDEVVEVVVEPSLDGGEVDGELAWIVEVVVGIGVEVDVVVVACVLLGVVEENGSVYCWLPADGPDASAIAGPAASTHSSASAAVITRTRTPGSETQRPLCIVRVLQAGRRSAVRVT
jgi:hypothetical protein